jgi:predicted nucleotidyltransferase
MRITDKDKQAIINMTHQHFDDSAEVYLFGSRVDDSKKGGDIDLYIIPKHKNSTKQLFDKKIKLLVALNLALGEQKIDVIIAKDKNRLIEKEAIRTGIKL